MPAKSDVATTNIPLRQKRYRGRPTIRSRIRMLACDGTLDSYTVEELAAMFNANPRTVACYINELKHAPLAVITPAMLPLTTTKGRMLIMMEWDRKTCEGCPALDLCHWLVKRDCYVACEKPLVDELWGGQRTPSPSPSL